MRLAFIFSLLITLSSFSQDSLTSSYANSKYFVGTSAFEMKAGDMYYTNYNLLTQFIAYAPFDGFCFKVGANPISFVLEQPVAIAELTYSHELNKNLALSTGVVYTFNDWGTHSMGGTVKCTLGDHDKNLSLGVTIGKPLTYNRLSNGFVIPLYLAGNLRLNKKNQLSIELHSLKFTEVSQTRGSDNYKLTESYFGMLGIRHQGKHNEVAYGLSVYTKNGSLSSDWLSHPIIPLPFAALTFDVK